MLTVVLHRVPNLPSLTVSRINFGIAGAVMYSLLMTSIDDIEVDFWIARVKEYHILLRAHAVGFDTSRLAAIRFDLLGKLSGNGDCVQSSPNVYGG